MSQTDIMLNAVIQMPYEMAMSTELSRRQFYERANQALGERNAQAAEIERLREALEGMVRSFEPYAWGSNENRSDALANARAALSGEPT